jgi:two-component system, NtrC family, nitrogen regulation sensor histidine kinase NtrY
MTGHRYRVIAITSAVLAGGLITWLQLLIQKHHHLIGGGIGRTFFFFLINLHVLVMLVLLFFITRHALKLVVERRQGIAGSIFKRNLLFAFILFSLLPALFVFFTAGTFITKSINRWFAARLEGGFASALYLHEQHTQELRRQLEAYSLAVARAYSAGAGPSGMQPPAMPVGGSLQGGCDWFIYTPGVRLSANGLQQEIVMWRRYRLVNDCRTRDIARRFIQRLPMHEGKAFDFYGSLYCAHQVRGQWIVVAYRYPAAMRMHLIRLERALHDYHQLHTLRPFITLSVFSLYVLSFLLILFLAIWCAFYLARGLSKPLQELLQATSLIGQGQWNVTVPVLPSSDIAQLATAFNDMTHALEQAHMRLQANNQEMLMILENLSAAVFLINAWGRITFLNKAAGRLTMHHTHIENLKGKKIIKLVEPLQHTIKKAVERLSKGKLFYNAEVSVAGARQTETLLAYCTFVSGIDLHASKAQQLLVVLEDITTVVTNRTIKTWQEAAKQVAHEIKNPLTPIQLATQRLQRKFTALLNQDPIFLDCTRVILDQVSTIKDLVNHFTQFASLPSSQHQRVNMAHIVHDIFALYQPSYPEVNLALVCDAPITLTTDLIKIKIILSNLLDNSLRAFQQQPGPHSVSIELVADTLKKQAILIFKDNGPGIPTAVQATLFMPYVSTSKKNMGLGLAIVYETVASLQGSICLVAQSKGACFLLKLPM